MARLFDLHIHTTKGSSDSSLTPEDLILEADRLGLRGLCLTEHSGPWDRHEFKRFAALHNVVLIRAMEVETDMGHMLAFGMDQYQAGFNKAAQLRKAATAAGGFVVSAHPFRGVLSSNGNRSRALIYQAVPDDLPETPHDALEHPVFKLADAVEVANGGTIDRENDFAMEVAGLLKMPVTGGSDAHSVHGLGKFLTEFQDEVKNEAEFLKALHSKKFHPVTGLRTGNLQRYTV
ncbi:MAG: PHP domain-containing protein [Chloroflexi bacterium]|nr:PHP domain-containing protein [Chloroflexota bacterium]MDA1271025.1 PHP domain-containing protein [Chloroflexota bacterium]